MSVWGRRGTYGATILVLVTFVALSLLADILRPAITVPENTALADQPGDFVRPAAPQSVKWRPWEPAAAAEARRLDKPLFILVGTPYSPVAYNFDRFLGIPDIAELLNRDFVCVRFDTVLNPAWRAGILPISSTLLGEDLSHRAFVVSGEGDLIDDIPTSQAIRGNEREFIARLRQLLREYSAATKTAAAREASDETFALCGGIDSGTADLEAYAQRVVERIADPRRPDGPATPVAPNPADLAFLLDTGRAQIVHEIVTNLYRSPRFSAVEDLLFYAFPANDPHRPVPTIVASQNARFLKVAARTSVVVDDPALAVQVRRHWDAVARHFATDGASYFIRANADELGRSQFSFTDRRLRQLLPPEDLPKARALLGLFRAQNPAFIPHYANPASLTNEAQETDRILAQLREADPPGPPPQKSRGELFTARAEAVACLIASARLLADAPRQTQALALFQQLRQDMRSGTNDVFASRFAGAATVGRLPAYLAYAEAAWEAFLAERDTNVANDGLEVLRRAFFLFTDENKVLRSQPASDFPPNWPALLGPDVVDGTSPALVSTAARLARAYSLWPGATPYRAGLESTAQSLVLRSSWVVDRLESNAGGLARAVLDRQPGRTVGVRGAFDPIALERAVPGAATIPLESQNSGKNENKQNQPNGLFIPHQNQWRGPVPLASFR